MIVTFTTRAYADITMFGDVAVRLLRLMGHSGTVPGALRAEDVPAALASLRQAVQAHGDEAAPGPGRPAAEDEPGKEPAVNLSQRAFPLLELLQAAAAEDCSVSWR